MQKIILFTIAILLAIEQTSGFSSQRLLSPLVPSEAYTNSAVIDPSIPDLLTLYWKLIGNKDEIQFEIHCKATGWVGFGISPSGNMAGSDIAIGWVSADGQGHLVDTFSTRRGAPLRDVSQDWFLLDSREVNGYTILKMKRKLVTGDLIGDLDIKAGQNFLIFGWHPNDPVSGANDWLYHGMNRRVRYDTLF